MKNDEAATVGPYDTRAIATETEAIPEDWARLSVVARNSLVHQLAVQAPGCPFHLYRRDGRTSNESFPPEAVFLHGGDWRGGSALTSSFVDGHLARLGSATAIPGYPLAPAAHLKEIARRQNASA